MNGGALHHLADSLQQFRGEGLTRTLSKIEAAVQGLTSNNCAETLLTVGVERSILLGAASLKEIAGQIHVVIHALGILLCLPHILEPGERVEYVSLGAGNTGRKFDLETNERIAEFKFIHWRGGAESIRQNHLFKDFFFLSESPTPKRKYLYVLDKKYPMKFFNGGRALTSVLSKDVMLGKLFDSKYGKQFKTVREYFLSRAGTVNIEDVSEWMPELAMNDSGGGE